MYGIVTAQAIQTYNGIATIKGFEGILANVLGAVFWLAGIALLLMLLWGGFKYMTAGGDPKALEGAKMTLTYAFIGLILAAGAFIILQLIQSITGANILNFNITL